MAEKLHTGLLIKLGPVCEAVRGGLALLPLTCGAYPAVLLPEITGCSSHP